MTTLGEAWKICERHGLDIDHPNAFDAANILLGLEAKLAAKDTEIAALKSQVEAQGKELWDVRIHLLVEKVVPLATELKDKWVRGRDAQGAMPCPICGNYIDWHLAGHGNRHTSGKCRGCWVEWQE